MKTEYDVSEFGTHNNTDKFALLAGGRYQLFESLELANEMLNRIIPDEDVEASDFGAFQLLPPNSGDGENITNAKETDLLAYAKNKEEASHLRVYGKIVSKWLRVK